MALTTEEQELYDFAKRALPQWMPAEDEFLHGAAKMFGAVRTLIVYLFAQAKISTATGPTYDGSGNMLTPDWLAQHAADRGTRRQTNEDDLTLRQRLRNVPDALTRSSILDACNAILAANGLPQTAAMVELSRDSAHAGTYQPDFDLALGGTFASAGGGLMVFTPNDPFLRPPYRDPSVTRLVQSYRINISATNAANSGSFAVSGISGNGAMFPNAGGAPGADVGADWSVGKESRRPLTSLAKSGGSGFAWDAGASSAEVITGDGSMRIVASETTTYRKIGFATAAIGVNHALIEYGLYLRVGGAIFTSEMGVEVDTGATYAPGDVLCVVRTGSVVKYKKNGATIATSAVPSSGSLLVGAAFLTAAGTLSNVQLSDASRFIPLTWQGAANVTATHQTLDGKARAYCRRGFRVAGSRPTIVIMLPYGTTAGIVASVREMLRQKKAAGVRALVERRLNP